MRKLIDLIESEYRGEHGAPDHEDGAPMHDLTHNGIYPDDVYGPRGAREYGYDAQDAYYQCMALRGRPNRIITIYRSVPKELVRPKITPGDWVTTSKAYAREHGRGNLGNDFKIISKTVNARDIFTEGNSLDEWGYDPQPYVSRDAEDEIRTRHGVKTHAEIAASRLAKQQASDSAAKSPEADIDPRAS